jgi:hypothetical protein
MANKTRNWTDVELIISSISIALTVGFWGLFASRQKVGADVLGQVSFASASGGPTPVSSTAVPSTLVPGQTVFFGTGAATQQPVSQTASQPKPRRKGDGGRGGGGAVAKTGSS